MNRLFTLVLAVVLLNTTVFADTPCPIIPYPNKIEKVNSVFKLTNQTTLVYDSEFAEIAYYFQKELLRHKNITIPKSLNDKKVKTRHNVIFLRYIPSGKADKISDEAFSMQMSGKQITIESSHPKGAFYGMISLLQLVLLSETQDSGTSVKCWNINDNPRYEWRGLMLDESRHFFGKEKVKQLLDWMALYKLNKFHWHLTDAPGWRIEIKKYPKLGYVGGIGNHSNPYTPAQYYTQEDIKEIVRYASERFIEIIPEIDMPGHASAANRAYPEFSGGGSKRFPEFTFNPGKEGTYTFLTNILREVTTLFPSKYIHIGGDEVHFGNEEWNTLSDVKDLMNKNKLQSLKEVELYFIKRMADSISKLDRTLIGWDEIATADLSRENTVVMWWRQEKPDALEAALNNGYKVILCPRLPLYFDFVQHDSHEYGRRWAKGEYSPLVDVYKFPVANTVSGVSIASPSVLGFQGNVWTETISTNERLDFMIFPRIAALAESAWNGNVNKDFELFQKRLKNHFSLYKANDIYYFDPFDVNVNSEPTK